MQFRQDSADAKFVIRKIDDTSITVNDAQHQTPIWLMPDTLIAPWDVTSVSDLSISNLNADKLKAGTILVLGTGQDIIRPEDALYEDLLKMDIILEVMGTRAACRTYQLLLSELRLAAAGLFSPRHLE